MFNDSVIEQKADGRLIITTKDGLHPKLIKYNGVVYAPRRPPLKRLVAERIDKAIEKAIKDYLVTKHEQITGKSDLHKIKEHQ